MLAIVQKNQRAHKNGLIVTLIYNNNIQIKISERFSGEIIKILQNVIQTLGIISRQIEFCTKG